MRTTRVIVCISGASGGAYAVRLLERLKCEKDLVVSECGLEVLTEETGFKLPALKKLATRYYDNRKMNCDIASGSTAFDAVVIVPCSMNTLAKVASGICDNLVTRVATVALKEKRKLIIVPREMPLSSIHLECMHKLSVCGAVVLPASPGFYKKPKTVAEMVDFVVDRILAQIET